MCKGMNEGGQRCASHAKNSIKAAAEDFDRYGDEERLQALISAHVSYASTPEGREVVLANLAAGEPAPGELDSSMWQRIADDGAAVRERNQAVAAAIKEVAAKGEAFHAEVQEKWGQYRHVPNGVRGPKSLAKFLTDENNKMRFSAVEFAEDFRTADRLDGILAQVQDAPVTPGATFEQRLPRSEEERSAWAAQLTKMAGSNRSTGRLRQEGLVEHNEVMARFGEHGWETDLATVVPPLDTVGALVRVKNDDGTLSDQEYVVRRLHDHDSRADGATTVHLVPLTVVPDTAGYPKDPDEPHFYQPEVTFQGQGTDKLGDRVMTLARLGPATESTISRFGHRMEIEEDRWHTEVAPHEYHTTLRGWTIGGRAEAAFDTWRKDWAREHAPYKTPKDSQGNSSFGSRVKGLFTG